MCGNQVLGSSFRNLDGRCSSGDSNQCSPMGADGNPLGHRASPLLYVYDDQGHCFSAMYLVLGWLL